MKCPHCDNLSDKVIYMGFPMRLCCDPSCSTVFGLWSFICFTFCWIDFHLYGGIHFYVYTSDYLTSVRNWFFHDEE